MDKNKTILSASFEVKRELPKNIVDKDLFLFDHEIKRNFSESYVLNEKNCFVFGQNILSIRKLSIFVKETFFLNPKAKKIFKDTLKNILPLRKFKSIDNGYWITDDKSTVYFHWFCDALQKITLIEGYENKVLLIPERFTEKQFVIDTLKLLNINYQVLKKNTLYKIKNIEIYAETAPTGNYNPTVLKDLRKLFLKKTKAETKPNIYKKLWILRDNDIREIENSEIIYPILESYGFEFIYFEKLTMNEKIKILNETLYLGGIWGSGLTNMLFLNEKTNLIEIRNKNDKHNNAFFSMASALNLNYFYYSTDFYGDKKSLNIDREGFESFLESIQNH
ncbi:MAG: hypothetical protein CMF94_04990 [Candidatus Marinimicrobia bacterium]|nr:hypothetical protein [Candidatus Neomarinimicrobiota bacterium]